MPRLTLRADDPAPDAAPEPAPAAGERSPTESAVPPPLVYDTADMCAVLRCSLATLHRLKAAGKLPRAGKLGGQLRWDASEIREWVSAGMPDLKRWEAMRVANNTN